MTDSRHNAFGIPFAFKGSWDIAGMTLSNQRLLDEIESMFIISLVSERQLRPFGRVVCTIPGSRSWF